MNFFDSLFSPPPYPSDRKPEVDKLITELIKVGKMDDFLSERPGGQFNAQCRNMHAREIGQRLHEIGGVPLMELAYRRVRRSLGKNMAAHLGYAWTDVGRWVY